MTKPEGHFADIATERCAAQAEQMEFAKLTAEQDKQREEFFRQWEIHHYDQMNWVGNRHLNEIQRQRSYMDDVKEAALTIGAMFFFTMCLWGTIVSYDWACTLSLENKVLKSELREERIAFKAQFVNQEVNVKRQDEERKAYVKKWQQENPKLAGIFNAR